MRAPRRPRRVLNPSASIATTGAEILARQRAVGPSAADQRVELVLAPLLSGNLGDDLLRQDIERLLREDQPVEFTAAHTVEQRGAFDELVARQREEAALGGAGHRVPRTPDALQQARDRARRAELAHQVDIADIDAELERSGCDQRFQRTGFQPLFGVEALLLGETAVMRGHPLGGEPFRQLPRHPLGEAAGIDEDQGRAMGLDQLGQPVVNLLPDFAGHHGFERRGRNFEGKVARPAMAGVDDPALGIGSDEKSGHRLDRLLRRREADAQQRAAAERGQPLERDRQMRAALVRRHRMNLVDDDRPRRRQHFAAGFGTEQDIERFRRGHDDVRRISAHALPLSRRRVAGAHPGADLHVRQPLALQRFADAGERGF